MDTFYHFFTYGFASLIAIVNPIGMAPLFLSMTQSHSDEARHRIAYKVAIYGFILLLVTFFVGPYVLNFFGISLASIQVAGGLLVFYSAWGMLDMKPKISSQEEQEAINKNSDVTFFPLTMPITAGAGAMAVTIALGAKISKIGDNRLLSVCSALLAIFAVFAVVAICYRYADSIFRKLGHSGTNIVSKLAAFILLAIAINLIFEGAIALILSQLH